MATAILAQPSMPGPVTPTVPDSESLYEVVDGQVLEKPPTAAISVRLASILLISLGAFLKEARLGRASTEMLHLLDAVTGLKRRPDLSFVSYDRWPISTPVPDDDAWPVVPDLAVEVLSPSNTAVAMKRKVREYFAANVRLVWVIYPHHCLIEVYTSLTDVDSLDRSGTLDGGAVLPGFRLALTDLFEDAIV